jgi:hypothetical protein
MMEKNGEIREGITPTDPSTRKGYGYTNMAAPLVEKKSEAPAEDVVAKLVKESEEQLNQLEDHMTTRAHTRVTDSLR